MRGEWDECLDMIGLDWDGWLETPQGQYLMAWECARVGARVVDIFGYHALQVGCPQLPLLDQSRIAHRHYMAFDDIGARRFPIADDGVLAALLALPFASASVDLVVLPHVLEFCPDPLAVLREIERVLTADGHLVLTGFNPLSLWALDRRTPFGWPGHQRLRIARVCDWLADESFDVHECGTGCYRPPLASARWLERWRLLDRLGTRAWPACGAAYMVHASKRTVTMRLIEPVWRLRRNGKAALMPAVRRDLTSSDGT